jgi:hypothetical protein
MSTITALVHRYGALGPCLPGAIALAGLAACGQGSQERPGSSRPTPSGQTPPEMPATGTPGARGVAGVPGPPWFSLPAGSRFFERDGRQAPLLMRNVSAPQPSGFAPFFADARAAGTTLVRLQLTQGFGYDTLGIDATGAPLPGWLTAWGTVFDEAERQGLALIPVFAIWGDWNSGEPALGWTHFDANPLGAARGGAAATPAELFADTPTQRAWLGWLSEVVERNADRPNIVAWEIFSELDLATGATEAGATALVERARAVIREKDPWSRPAFASTSDLPLINGQPWRVLWDSPDNDIVAVHPYAEELDRVAVDRARSVLGLTSKPVLIGESGLSAAEPTGATLTSAPNAAVGLTHAIWAELVSGAASARAFYWEDGYSIYYPGSGRPLIDAHKDLERHAAEWLAGKDFRGLSPLTSTTEGALFGVVLGGPERVLGWARNARLLPPEWRAAALGDEELRVTLAPGVPDRAWTVELSDAVSGARTQAPGSSRAGLLSFRIPGPWQSLAFDATPVPGSSPDPHAPSACPDVSAGGCTGAAYQLTLNGSSVLSDPACPAAPVNLELHFCRDKRLVSLQLFSCPSSELGAATSCVSLDVGDIGGEPSGSGDYFDAAGTRYALSVDALELDDESAPSDTIQRGVASGTLTGGDAGATPFTLVFQGCLRGPITCLR